MLQHQYILRTEDYVLGYLYNYSLNKEQNKKDIKAYFGLFMNSLLIGLIGYHFLEFNIKTLLIFLLAFTLYEVFDFYMLRKKRIKNKYLNYLKGLNSSTFNKVVDLKIDTKEILFSSYTGYNATYFEQLENVTVFEKLLSLNFKDESKYLIRFENNEKYDEFLSFFENQNIPIIDRKNWK